MRLTLNEIAFAVDGVPGRAEHGDILINSVTTDSRSVPAGSLFIPIVGEFFNGHDFIADAFLKGACAAFFCDCSFIGSFGGCPVIKVDDTRKALLRLASYYIGTLDVKKIGITGSSGKTTTKDIITSVLAQRYITHKTQGNYNNDIGLPLTVLNLPQDAEAAVLEMGMNNLGEIRPLSVAVIPDIAVISNIGVAHIENLGSREGILHAKLEILEGLSKNGLALFNGDDDMLNNLKIKARLKYFGFGGHNHYRAVNMVKRGIAGVDFTALFDGKALEIAVPIPGTHMVYNALAAVAAGVELGLSDSEIQAGIRNFAPSGGRMKIEVSKNGVTVINDTYNANPDSVKAALDVLAQAEGRKIAVLGGMLELGKDAEKMHEEIGGYAAGLGLDLILCVGELGGFIHKGAEPSNRAILFEDKESAALWLSDELKQGDTVLVKASRSMAFEDISNRLL